MFFILIIAAILGLLLQSKSYRGWWGERKVQFLLSFLPKKNYASFHHVLLPVNNGETTEIDHIIVSPTAVFVIESKNYYGIVSGKDYDTYWIQTISNDYSKEIYNPILQNSKHVDVVASYLKNFTHIPIVSLITFSSRARLKDIYIKSSSTKVIYVSQLIRTIKSYTNSVIAEHERKEIIEILDKNNCYSQKEMRKHIARIRYNHDRDV